MLFFLFFVLLSISGKVFAEDEDYVEEILPLVEHHDSPEDYAEDHGGEYKQVLPDIDPEYLQGIPQNFEKDDLEYAPWDREDDFGSPDWAREPGENLPSDGDVKIEVIRKVPDADCKRRTVNLDSVYFHYTGWLRKSGAVFDTSASRTPFSFILGLGMVIPGWDEGLMDMCVGEQRRLTVPSGKGYGDAGISTVPAAATLMFDVELIKIKSFAEEKAEQASRQSVYEEQRRKSASTVPPNPPTVSLEAQSGVSESVSAADHPQHSEL